MKIRLFLYTGVLTSLVYCSCGSGTEYGIDPVTAMYDSIAEADSLRQWGPPTPVEFGGAIDVKKLDMMRVSIEGYVGLSDSITQTDDATIIQLWQRKGQRVGDCYSIVVNMGTGLNTMDSLPEGYVKSDLNIRDNSLQNVSLGDKVKITGIYHAPVNSTYGTIDVQLIERQDFKPETYNPAKLQKLTPEIAADVKENDLVYAEGFIIVPSSLHVTDFVPLKLIASRNADDSLSVDINIGDGANMIRNLPDNYSDDDVKIHDNNDKVVGFDKVRVYGVWHQGSIAVEYIETIR